MVNYIRTVSDAKRLAGDINSARRTKPIVVVTTPAGVDKPFINPEDIESEVGELADVFLIPTGPESRAFSREMPDLTQVYGGAGRVYPVGTGWVHDPYRSPLRFAWGSEEGPRAARLLVTDALRMAAEAGLLSKPASGEITVGGVVEQLVLPSRALVRTDQRHVASIRQELLCPDVPIDRLVSVGMRVHGSLDPESRRYDVRQMILPSEEALAPYRTGDVALALVDKVDADNALLLLHPEVGVVVRREDVTSNDLDRVSSLMSPGEVLAVRIVSNGPEWHLSLLDLNDDEQPRPAPSLLQGGPPWLLPAVVPEPVVETERASELEAPELLIDSPSPEVPSAPDPYPVPRQLRRPTPLLLDRRRVPSATDASPEVDALRRALADSRSQLDSARSTMETLRQEVVDIRIERQLLHNHLEKAKGHADALEQQLKQSRTALRKARQKVPRGNGAPRGGDLLFHDDEEQFRFEVLVAWAHRIPAAEKAQRPLKEYSLGANFLPSVATVPGIDRRKLVDVTVEVLTGLADTLDGRYMHQLRTGEAGAPPRVRDDGATSWRVALQANAPAARRLHFWRLKAGAIELSRVALHDDFRP